MLANEDDEDNIFIDRFAFGEIRGSALEPDGTPIQGSTIRLSTSDGDAVNATITNIDGFYQFLSVPTGNYILQQDDIPGFVNVSDFDETPEDDDDDVDCMDNFIIVTVTSGEIDEDNVFRDERADGTISGTIRDVEGTPLILSLIHI